MLLCFCFGIDSSFEFRSLFRKSPNHRPHSRRNSCPRSQKRRDLCFTIIWSSGRHTTPTADFEIGDNSSGINEVQNELHALQQTPKLGAKYQTQRKIDLKCCGVIEYKYVLLLPSSLSISIPSSTIRVSSQSLLTFSPISVCEILNLFFRRVMINSIDYSLTFIADSRVYPVV